MSQFFDPGAEPPSDLERIAEALQGIRKELGLLRHSLEAIAKTRLLRSPPRRPDAPPGLRSRR